MPARGVIEVKVVAGLRDECAGGVDLAAGVDTKTLRIVERKTAQVNVAKVDRVRVGAAEQIVAGDQCDVAALDGANIEQVLRGLHTQVSARSDLTGIEQITCLQAGILATLQGARIDELIACIDVDGAALDHRTASDVVGGLLTEVDDRHQYLFAVDGFVDQPHHVLRKARHLSGCQRHANSEIELLCFLRAGIHERFVLVERVGVAVEITSAGEAGDLVHHQLRFVEGIAQALQRGVAAQAQLVEQVVATEKAAVAGKARIGFDQIGAAAAGVNRIQTVAGQLDRTQRIGRGANQLCTGTGLAGDRRVAGVLP